MIFIVLSTILLFCLGIYFYSYYSVSREGFDVDVKRCPNILIQKDSRFYLFNSNLAKVPGVNPIEFANLEDYTEFLEWQHSQGIRCPVLYLQQTYDAQGKPVYKVRPGVSDLQGGLTPSGSTPLPPNPTLLTDATRDDKPYNINSFPSYDQSSTYVGATTPLDTMNSQGNLPYSPNPMDDNWGGNEFTQKLIEQGYYKGNEVALRVA